MSALGQSGRTNQGTLFCTELAAFFAYKKECYTRSSLKSFFKNHNKTQFTRQELEDLFSGAPKPEDPKGMFHGFERTNFGIIHIRTDGKRILVFTHSGKKGLNEAYRYKVSATHQIKAENLVKK